MCRIHRCWLLLALAGALACGPDAGRAPAPSAEEADAAGHTAATQPTQSANAAVRERLPLDDPRDFEDAQRGLLARDPEVVVRTEAGVTVWDTGAYAFVRGEAPASVHPALWRQARLNGIHGLFQVTDGVYQVRGYDLSNLTLIEGRTGWIVVDPLTSVETARAALDLAQRQLGERPVTAVIYTHSHIDHFGGVAGVLPADELERSRVRVVAPAGFVHEATSENVLAGVAMARRAAYMFGMPLARSERGHVDSGLGKGPARARVGIFPPTDIVDRTPQELEIDGVRFVFQHAPESEAPAELTFYLPHVRAFCGAEVVSHTMHNLYTLRGAKVRDALRWAGYIDEALELFADAEVVFASHHWPIWGRERVVDYLEKQRDTYRYIHDQTLRLANSGATPQEIAEQLELPESLRSSFPNLGYYGTVRHNAKAVYQFYFGWYDGNPAHLDPLPPAEASRRYVEAMGGAAAVRDRAQRAFDGGEYRWAATLLDHLVFADPEDAATRELLARTYDQLGYRAGSGPWRDVYLTGAHELRHGVTAPGTELAEALDLLRHVPMSRFFDAMATRLNGPRADGHDASINFVFTDLEESYVLQVRNAVLHHRQRPPDPDADATVRLTQDFFLRLTTGQLGLRDVIFSDDLDVEGSRLELLGFFRLLDRPEEAFAIVTP
jgi:alkyl sulfatase BDS1-like metallo-beta-lactamase superfamily hydrolase